MTAPYKVKWYPDDVPDGHAAAFLGGLSEQCKKKLLKLEYQLSFRGPKLAQTEMLKHLEGDVWELRDLCDGGALRVYIFRDGVTFYKVSGEVKNGRARADQARVDRTQACCNEHRGSPR